MLIPPEAWQALIDAGIELLPLSADTADLRTSAGPALGGVEVKVHQRPRPLTPSGVRAMAASAGVDRLLLIVPSASQAVLRAAKDAGISLIALNPRSAEGPTGMIVLPARAPVYVGSTWGSPLPRPRPRGRTPWGSLTVIRRLLTTSARRQTELAALSGVSQPRVSQVLSLLADEGLVEVLRGEGCVVRDWYGLLSRWLSDYPGSGGIATYWYGLDSVLEQTQRVLAFLADDDLRTPRRGMISQRGSPRAVQSSTRLALSTPRPIDPSGSADSHYPVPSGDPGRPLLSGDVAADFLAPWRRPRRGVVYVRAGADLSSVGLTPSGADTATTELIVPADPGIWPPATGHHRAGSRLGGPAHRWGGVGDDDPGGAAVPWLGVGRDPATAIPQIADPLQILWDVRRTAGPDADQAVAHLVERMLAFDSLEP